jgi:hypothetical protein
LKEVLAEEFEDRAGFLVLPGVDEFVPDHGVLIGEGGMEIDAPSQAQSGKMNAGETALVEPLSKRERGGEGDGMSVQEANVFWKRDMMFGSPSEESRGKGTAFGEEEGLVPGDPGRAEGRSAECEKMSRKGMHLFTRGPV